MVHEHDGTHILKEHEEYKRKSMKDKKTYEARVLVTLSLVRNKAKVNKNETGCFGQLGPLERTIQSRLSYTETYKHPND